MNSSLLLTGKKSSKSTPTGLSIDEGTNSLSIIGAWSGDSLLLTYRSTGGLTMCNDRGVSMFLVLFLIAETLGTLEFRLGFENEFFLETAREELRPCNNKND